MIKHFVFSGVIFCGVVQTSVAMMESTIGPLLNGKPVSQQDFAEKKTVAIQETTIIPLQSSDLSSSISPQKETCSYHCNDLQPETRHRRIKSASASLSADRPTSKNALNYLPEYRSGFRNEFDDDDYCSVSADQEYRPGSRNECDDDDCCSVCADSDACCLVLPVVGVISALVRFIYFKNYMEPVQQ